MQRFKEQYVPTPRKNGSKSEEIDRQDRTRLYLFLHRGFSVASNYGDMNRNRYHISLADSTTETELYNFCSRFLRGSPMPESDPILGGPKILRMFQAAEKAGLVSLTFTRANDFIPERFL